MKNFKGFFAVILVIAVLSSLSGCHKKGEVALASNGYNISAGLYSYYLIMADSDAKAIIQGDDAIDTTAAGFNYLKQTIDGKSYTDYVKDLAIKKCLEAITYEKLCKDNNLTIEPTIIDNSNYQAEIYWNNYGYSSVLEPNGVSLDTYKKAILSTVYADTYFKFLYDEGGQKAISDKDIDDTLTNKYAAVYMLSKDYSSDTSADATTLENTFNDYKSRIAKGEDFKKIYNEYNKITEEQTKENKEDATPAPKDELISIIGAEDTYVSFEHFEKVKSLKEDAIEVIHDTEAKQLYLIVKKDITDDSYYRDEYLKTDILYLIKGDEFDKFIQETAEALEYTTNNHVINLFKVKNIKTGTN